MKRMKKILLILIVVVSISATQLPIHGINSNRSMEYDTGGGGATGSLPGCRSMSRCWVWWWNR